MKVFVPIRILTLVLALALVLAGCGGVKGPDPQTDQELLEIFTTLLAQDFEVDYLFYGGGVTVRQQDSIRRAEQAYWPSDSPRYQTLGDLEALLAATYADAQEQADLLGKTTPGGALLFVEENKTLYKNEEEWVSLPPYTTLEDSIRLAARGENTAEFQFEQEGADGSLYQCSLSMVRTGEGWRLATQLRRASRTTVREGTGETSLFGDGEALALARRFLDALVSGNTTALEAMTYAQEGTYAAWGALEVTAAEMTEVVEDLDVQGEYLVELTVGQGGGILEEGTAQYRLKVGMRNAAQGYGVAEGLSVDYFQPQSLAPYELQEGPEHRNPAAEAVSRLILFFGPQVFETPEQLGVQRITEYVLMDLNDGPDPQPHYNQAQVAAGAKRLFGITDFTPSPDYYQSHLGGFAAFGRGGHLVNKLTFPGEREGERTTVTVELYSDPLQTERTQTLVYTLEETPEGWRFVSALPQ